MKKSQYFPILLLFLFFLIGCSGKRHVTLNAMRPAEITFDPSVNTILIVDRSKFEKKAVNIIEGVLTGEGIAQDKAAVQAFLLPRVRLQHGEQVGDPVGVGRIQDALSVVDQ